MFRGRSSWPRTHAPRAHARIVDPAHLAGLCKKKDAEERSPAPDQCLAEVGRSLSDYKDVIGERAVTPQGLREQVETQQRRSALRRSGVLCAPPGGLVVREGERIAADQPGTGAAVQVCRSGLRLRSGDGSIGLHLPSPSR